MAQDSEPTLAGNRQRFKPVMRRSGEINQRDTVVDHVILSQGQALEIADAPVSFLLPRRRHAIVKLACRSPSILSK